MRRIFHHHGLSIVVGGLFLIFLAAHSVAGVLAFNDEQRQHGQPEIGYGQYLVSGEFWSSVGENWESEFLQMAMFIVLAKRLYQKGSSESKDPDEPEGEEDEDPRKHRHNPNAPWPVRKGGWVLTVYEHSLSIAFAVLFLLSIGVHAVGGWRAQVDEQLQHGESPVSFLGFLGSAAFWYQSMQNWQSEFLAIFCMVVFSIFLRERGSPQSKPVHSGLWETTG